MIVVYVIAGILGLALVGEILNIINYRKDMRQAKLDRYKRMTEEMMKPSLSKAILGYRPYLNKLKEEDEEEEEV